MSSFPWLVSAVIAWNALPAWDVRGRSCGGWRGFLSERFEVGLKVGKRGGARGAGRRRQPRDGIWTRKDKDRGSWHAAIAFLLAFDYDNQESQSKPETNEPNVGQRDSVLQNYVSETRGELFGGAR